MVIETLRVERWRRRTPSAASSAAIPRLTEDLGGAQVPGGRGHAAGLGDGDEDREEVEVERSRHGTNLCHRSRYCTTRGGASVTS